MHAWKEIICGVGLAIAGQPIHEGGHAVASRLLTGLWPQISFWAVYPVGRFESKTAALTVLAAGDIAVVVWWLALFGLVRHYPERKWMLVGPTFMVAIALLNWTTSAALTPFGYGHIGASDAEVPLYFRCYALGNGWVPGYCSRGYDDCGGTVLLEAATIIGDVMAAEPQQDRRRGAVLQS